MAISQSLIGQRDPYLADRLGDLGDRVDLCLAGGHRILEDIRLVEGVWMIGYRWR